VRIHIQLLQKRKTKEITSRQDVINKQYSTKNPPFW
jgi:hypothetical protein